MDNQLLVQVERLRGQMVATAARRESMLHREVIQISQRLDELIYRVQTEKRPGTKLKRTP